jgi:hypothetical protein
MPSAKGLQDLEMQLSNTRSFAYDARMPRSAPPLLTRLRRHRGLWVFAVAVLLIKLVSSSICIADVSASSYTTTQATTAVVADVAAPVHAEPQQDCLLGEGGSCHCACGHTLTVPANAFMAWVAPAFAFTANPLPPSTQAAFVGSLLRPPIA